MIEPTTTTTSPITITQPNTVSSASVVIRSLQFVLYVEAPRTSGQHLGLQLVELLLGDRAAVEQFLGPGDLTGRPGRAAVGGDLLHVLVEVGLRDLGLLHAALRHALALGDHVDQHTEERQDDQEYDPRGLRPARDVAPEQVAEAQDQDPDPGHPAEEDDHRPEDVHKRIVR